MVIFKKYASFYDNLYQDKDYDKEVQYILNIFKKYSSITIKSILDLGCGTGNHDIALAKLGYMVTGVDQSLDMLKIAKEKAKAKNLLINYFQGDIKKINLKKKFDAVISMFAVMGYQITNKDFETVLATTNKHLKNNGLFIFDIWYGPAVLADNLKDKIKKVATKNGYILRKTQCVLDSLKQLVKIRFTTLEYDLQDKIRTKDNEEHLMRFFFYQEIEYFLSKTGFKLIKILPFLELEGEPTDKDWNIMVVCQKTA